MKQYKMIAIILLAVNVGLALAAYMMLPDIVTTQLSITGDASRTMPKAAAVILPLVFAAGGTAMQFSSTEGGNARKGLLLSVVGIVILIIMLFVNL